MSATISFSINRIASPRRPFADFLALCRRLEVKTVEIRNDLNGCEIRDGTPAEAIKAAAAAAGVRIRTINALYPFDVFDPALERRAVELAGFAARCGAEALVMCPLNSPDDRRGPDERHAGLVTSLARLQPILAGHGLLGLIEPLGFATSALRRKSQAVAALRETGCEGDYRLVHDTFHHYLAGEEEIYPELTGLVHISGVEDPVLADPAMRDEHRVLVGPADRLGNLAQLKALLQGGYDGVVSFEPFAAEIQDATDDEARLKASMDFIRRQLQATTA